LSLDDTIRAELERRADLYERARNDVALQDALYERCRRDPEFWARHFLWTYDTRRPPHNLPFTFFKFQLELFKLFVGEEPRTRAAKRRLDREGRRHRRVVIDKCRDTGISWVSLAGAVYNWQFRGGGNTGIISRKKEEVDDGSEGSLFGKLRTLIKCQPAWMRPSGFRHGGPFDRDRFDDRYMLLINRDNGNVIAGSTTTTSAFRSRRYARVFIDEGAAIPLLFELLKSINDVTPAVWIVSTPNGMNDFGRLVHGKYGRVRKYGDPADDGVGWIHYRVTHDMDPRKTDAWLETQKAERSDTEIAQELLVDYEASDERARIWPEFKRRRHMLTDDEWRNDIGPFLDGATIIEGWDFGSGPSLTAVVWCAHFPSEDILAVIDYRAWTQALPVDIARDVIAAGWYAKVPKGNVLGLPPMSGGRLPNLRVGDPAMEQTESDQRSWRKRMRDYGIHIKGKRRTLARALLHMRERLGAGKIVFSPRCDERRPGMKKRIPTLVESVQGYKRNTPEHRSTAQDYVGNIPKPRPDIHSHLCDALSYAVEWAFMRPKVRTL
jgi:hypothetical protein